MSREEIVRHVKKYRKFYTILLALLLMALNELGISYTDEDVQTAITLVTGLLGAVGVRQVPNETT